MRPYGAGNPYHGVPVPPDSVQTLLIEGSSGQARDWLSTLSQIVRISGVSTAGALLNFWVNLQGTGASAPTTGSTGTSTGSSNQQFHVQGSRVMQIPGGSTGFSVVALSSGYVTVETWRK